MGRTSACDLLREDHRAIEEWLDELSGCLRRLVAGRLPRLRAAAQQLRELAAVHFAREETVFYPSLRAAFPVLLDEMDSQHAAIRELEQHVAGMLAQAPAVPVARWLDELYSLALEWHDRIQHHIVAEEDELLFLAEQHLTPDAQQQLAATMSGIASPKPAPPAGEL